MSEILGEALEFELSDSKVIMVPSEARPVSSVNGMVGDVRLKTSDLPNDAGYVTEKDTADVWFLDNLDGAATSLGDCTVIRAGGKVGILDFGGDQTGNAILQTDKCTVSLNGLHGSLHLCANGTSCCTALLLLIQTLSRQFLRG